MKRLFFISLLFLVGDTCFAKSDSSVTVKSKLAIGISYSPTLDIYRYTYLGGISKYETDTEFGYGTRLGINVEIPVCKKLVLSTGLYYNAKKSKYEIGVGYPFVGEKSLGYWALQKQYRIQLLEIPLLIKYNVRYLNKMNIHLSGGASTNLLIREHVLFDDTGGELFEGTVYHESLLFSFSAIIAVGVDYHFSEKVTVSLQPELINYFTAVSQERPGYQIQRPKISTVALNLGAVYKF